MKTSCSDAVDQLAEQYSTEEILRALQAVAVRRMNESITDGSKLAVRVCDRAAHELGQLADYIRATVTGLRG